MDRRGPGDELVMVSDEGLQRWPGMQSKCVQFVS